MIVSWRKFARKPAGAKVRDRVSRPEGSRMAPGVVVVWPEGRRPSQEARQNQGGFWGGSKITELSLRLFCTEYSGNLVVEQGYLWYLETDCSTPYKRGVTLL